MDSPSRRRRRRHSAQPRKHSNQKSTEKRHHPILRSSIHARYNAIAGGNTTLRFGAIWIMQGKKEAARSDLSSEIQYTFSLMAAPCKHEGSQKRAPQKGSGAQP